MLRDNYVVVNGTQFHNDCKASFKHLAVPQKFISAYLMSLNLADSTFSNMFANYVRQKVDIDSVYMTEVLENCDVGYLKGSTYHTLLDAFNLEDKYKLVRRYEMTNDDVSGSEVSKTSPELIEVLTKMNKTLDDIAYALLVISENTQKSQKPVAKLDDKK